MQHQRLHNHLDQSLQGHMPLSGFAAQHRFQRLWGRQSSADVFVPSQRTQAAHRQLKRARAVAEAITLQAEDKWIERTLNALHNEQVHPRLKELQEECLQTLETQRMPSLRNEEYRYTDISLLLRTDPQEASGCIVAEQVQKHELSKEAAAIRVVVVNGKLSAELSDMSRLPGGSYIGSLSTGPTAATAKLGVQARTYGGPFAVLNGALAPDVVCISVPAGAEVEAPIHVVYFTSGAAQEHGLPTASPRLLVHLGERASCQVVEEFAAAEAAGRCLTNAVAEMHLEEGASLRHGYVELEGKDAWHVKASLVHQAASSNYALTEVQLGGMLTRHDLSIQQAGPETETVMRSFLLCGPSQLHDLHSKLRLTHPRGKANQLHKCIVSASSGRGVFDGNVKVERFAQQTDAAQLSRNLLLAPKATVNVKPNLQIVADDVKCSHGCAVSDLEEEQLFYFRTRGIDDETARQVLVHSFGSEVTQYLKHNILQARIQEKINSTLALAPLS